MQKFWQMKALAQGEAEIWIYEMIGYDWWTGGGITAKSFSDDLKALGDLNKIILRINSPGGDVFDGNAIYNILKSHQAEVEVHIDGLAASIASVIAMAGNKVIMPENAMIMIHNPWACGCGEADDLRKMADSLDKIRESIVATYLTRTSLSKEVLIQMMDDETWMTADEAVNNGFADEQVESVKAAASFKMGYFKNVPEQFENKSITEEPAEVVRLAANRKRTLEILEADNS